MAFHSKNFRIISKYLKTSCFSELFQNTQNLKVYQCSKSEATNWSASLTEEVKDGKHSQFSSSSDDFSTLKRSQHSTWKEKDVLRRETAIELHTYLSGSYRSDRLRDTWISPNMSRLHLDLTRSSSRAEASTSYNMRSLSNHQISSKPVSLAASIISSSENFEGDIDSRYSDVSSANSNASESRLLRSSARKLRNESNGHQKQILAREHQTFNELQPNTNNLTGFSSLLTRDEQKQSVTPIGRSRRPYKSQMKSGHQSPTKVLENVNLSHSNAPNVLSATSTYVYTYVPQAVMDPMVVSSNTSHVSTQSYNSGDGHGTTDNSSWSRRISSLWKKSLKNLSQINTTATNLSFDEKQSNFRQKHSRGWLALNMFGLETDTERRDFKSKILDHQFLSSDAEDDNNMHHATKHVTSRSKTHVYCDYSPQSMTGYSGAAVRQSILRIYTQYALSSLRDLFIQILAVLMTFFYAIGNIFVYILSCLPLLCDWLFLKSVGEGNIINSAPRSPYVLHPRLLKFQGHVVTPSSQVRDSLLTMKSNRYSGRHQDNCWKISLRFLLPALILFPLLLFLSLLLSPADKVSDKLLFRLIPILSDVNCASELSEPRPDITHLWSLFAWRARCFYVRYFISSVEDASNKRASWVQWIPFFLRSTSNDQPSVYTDFSSGSSGEVAATKLIEQLTSFSQSVNKRLDLLSQTIKATDDRLIDFKQDSLKESDILNSQLNEMRNVFSHHLNEWRQFYMKYNQVNGNNVDKLSSDNTKVLDNQEILHLESELLLKTALEAANSSIAMQLNSLRNEILREHFKSEKKRNLSLIHVSVLMNGLREQLNFRSKQSQHELQKLRLQLMSVNNDRSKKFTDFDRNLLQLQNTVSVLTLRLSHLEKLNRESESTFTFIKDELRKCTENEVLVKHCHESVIEHVNTSFINLSRILSTQIKEIVQEYFILKELNNSNNMDSLQQTLSKLIRESFDNLIRDHRTKLAPVSLGKEVNWEHMIDKALHRFAADRTGLVDYALESAGGSIVGTRCTKTYTEGASLFSIFGVPLARLSNSPRTILQPGNNPGDCWPFHGSKGQAIIRLSSPINITSALQSEYDEDGVTLGSFTYDVSDKPVQTFHTKEYPKAVQFIELVILSNHGHPKYTCIYRFRVHGNMTD
ncbi:unnamed protein product [Heterobilharzia americana]|nr:unnamed protein product [Heterobilharzia americana]